MRQRFSYDIATYDETWRRIRASEEYFSRPPRDVARALLETWLLDHPDQVTGGERIAVSTDRHPQAHESITPTIRVRVYAAGVDPDDAEPLAIGYLGHDARDFAGASPAAADAPDGARGWRRVGAQVRHLPVHARGLAHQAVTEHRKETGLVAAAVTSAVAGLVAVRRLRRLRRLRGGRSR